MCVCVWGFFFFFCSDFFFDTLDHLRSIPFFCHNLLHDWQMTSILLNCFIPTVSNIKPLTMVFFSISRLAQKAWFIRKLVISRLTQRTHPLYRQKNLPSTLLWISIEWTLERNNTPTCSFSNYDLKKKEKSFMPSIDKIDTGMVASVIYLFIFCFFATYKYKVAPLMWHAPHLITMILYKLCLHIITLLLYC